MTATTGHPAHRRGRTRRYQPAHRQGGARRSLASRLGTLLAWALAALLLLALSAAGVIPTLVTMASLPFVYLLLRAPVLRRLAVRNAARRPRETALVILGALLGTAIITSSFVVGDTLTSSIHQSAYTQLGPVDEVVLAAGPAAGQVLAGAIDRAHIAGIDGTLSLLTLQAAVSSSGHTPLVEPKAQIIETDFVLARAFGGDPGATGISGPTPTGDGAVIGADLAHELGVTAGDDVKVFAYGDTRSFRIERLLPRVGVAGLATFTNLGGSTSPNLFVAPGTLTAMQSVGPEGGQTAPPLSVVAVSNAGSVTSGVKHTSAVHARLVAALRGRPAQVQDVKKELLDLATAAGKSFSQLFQGFGDFSVAAGILLLINMFVMLAQERKQALGMLRAVGMRRLGLVGSFALEGWMYTVVSSVAGVLVGVGIGRLVISSAARIFNQAGGRNDTLRLQFAVSRHALQSGFVAGFSVALVTVVGASVYVAFLNVIRAIRDLPEPPRERRRGSVVAAGAALVVVGLALTASGGGATILVLIGPAVLGVGLAISSVGRLPARASISAVSLAVIGWSVAASGILHRAFQNAGIDVFVAQGIILNVYAVLLITFNQVSILGAVRAVSGGARNMSLRLGMAYSLAKRFRTGLLLAMYAIVVFVLVLLAIISHLFSSQVNDQATKMGGGAALFVDSNGDDPVPAQGIAPLSPHVVGVTPTASVNADFALGAATTFYTYATVGYDDALIGHGAPTLQAWSRRYLTQAAVYRAAAADPTKIIVGTAFGAANFGLSSSNVHPGASATMRDQVTGRITKLTVIGVISSGASLYDGSDHVFISRALSNQVFGARSTSNLLYVSTTPGSDNDALAAVINGRYLANGADATSFRATVDNQFAVEKEFLALIGGYVALGLLVGIAGLGVVMVRAVRERRREIGILRALGLTSMGVRRAFLAESSFIALEGIGIGTILALVTGWQLVTSGNAGKGVSFSVPWGQIGLLVVVTYVASLLATAAPAVHASRIRPAIALRTTD